MAWEAWFTVGLIGFLFLTLVRGLAPTDVTLLGGTVLLAVVGVIGADDAVRGFSNPGMLTVAALFVVSAGMRETGALDRIGGRLLGKARTERWALARLGPQIVALSAFLNNTAVVAMLISVVSDWCRKHRVSPSRLLIPLSYFSIFGGICTLIGTSTNLVVFGLMQEQSTHELDTARQAALQHVSLFDFAYVGLPLAVVGTAYLLLLGRRGLPNREDLLERLGESSREYVVEMSVRPECRLVGQQIEEAGLRRLPGLFLIEIVREGRVIAPVAPTEVILAGDRLTFAGVVGTIVDLERIPGLLPAADDTYAAQAADRHQRRYCEAVVSGTSPLIGKNIREGNFRALYNAAVVAVHRGGERLSGRIGDIVLRSGDTLLLQTGAHFALANRNNPDFYLVSSLEEARPVRHERAFTAAGLLVLLIALLVFGERLGMPTHIAAFLVAGLMLITRCISAGDARRSVQWDVLLTIVAAFGIGAGLEKSGAAHAIAGVLTTHTQEWGPVVALAIIYAITSLFTELITNNAAAVLVFPIAMSLAEQLGVSPRPFAFAIAYAASSSFATPIGYQTNLMVYGPGGYRFVDFLRVGLPLNILLWIVAVLVIPLIWPFELP